MGLDISKITNAVLKKLAYLKDEDNSGILESEEFTIFKQEAASKENVSAEDFSQTMGLYVSNPAKATETATVREETNTTEEAPAKTTETATVTEETAAKETAAEETKTTEEAPVKRTKEEQTEFDRAKNTVLRYMDELSTVSRNDFVTKLETKIGSQKEDPRYVELMKIVKSVLDLMPETYSSLDDIKAKHKEIVKQLNSDNIEDNKLQTKILEKLEKNAEAEVRKAALKQIDDLYTEALRQNLDPNVKTKQTNEEIMNAIKQGFEDKSEFKGAIKDAFESYEKTVIIEKSKLLVLDAIEKVSGQTEWEDVREATKEILIEDGTWDKYTEQALCKKTWDEFVNGNVAWGKQKCKIQATDNNIEAKTTQTKAEVLKVLGNKSTVYEALVSSEMITVDESGNVDLSLLSELIGIYTGPDNTLNRHQKMQKVIGERINLQSALSVKAQLSSLTEKEAVQLAKLCGYDVEGKDWGRIFLGALCGALEGAVTAVGAGAMQPRQTVVVEGDVLNHQLNLNLTGDFDIAFLEQQFPGATITQTATGILINISQIITNPDTIIKLSKNLAGLGIGGALIGAALGALKASDDKGEQPIHPANVEATTYEEYAAFITAHCNITGNQKYLTAFLCLAAGFIKEDGTWDKAAWLQKLGKQSGMGSLMNSAEAPDSCRVDDVQQDDGEDTSTNNPTYSINDNKKEKTVYDDVPTVNGKGKSWAGIASQYKCLVEKYGLSDAIRMVKLAQAINDGDYSQARMEDLLARSKRGLAAMRNIVGFDYNKYYGAYKGSYLSRYEYQKDDDGNYILDTEGQKIPVKGTGVKVPVSLAGCDRDTSINKTFEMSSGLITHHPSGHAADRIESTETTTDYEAYFNDQYHNYGSNQNERNEAVQNYVNENPNAVRVDWENRNKTTKEN